MGNYKHANLEALANHGNGHFAYIDTLDEARKVFVEQGGALVCVAKDVKFQVEFNPARVTAYRLLGYENRMLKAEDFKNDAKDAGDMGSGHTVTALYEIVPSGVKMELPGVDPLKYQKVEPAANASPEWFTVKMRYKDPDAGTSKEFGQALTGPGAEMTADFKFASAVAEFGMLLRDSKYKGRSSYDALIERAAGALGDDPNGHRRAFVELARKAKGLTARAE
jgi:Ca-activated chloride channel family protein